MRIAQLAPPWITVPPAGYGGTEWVVQQLCDGLVARVIAGLAQHFGHLLGEQCAEIGGRVRVAGGVQHHLVPARHEPVAELLDDPLRAAVARRRDGDPWRSQLGDAHAGIIQDKPLPRSVRDLSPGGRVTAMILYLDCASGISGDMLVAALLAVSGTRPDDPGVLEDVVRPALAAAGIDPRLVSVAEERRGGFAAFAFQVADGPGFATFDELIMSMYASDLEQPVADAVASIAERMAAAEAEVHGRG